MLTISEMTPIEIDELVKDMIGDTEDDILDWMEDEPDWVWRTLENDYGFEDLTQEDVDIMTEAIKTYVNTCQIV